MRNLPLAVLALLLAAGTAPASAQKLKDVLGAVEDQVTGRSHEHDRDAYERGREDQARHEAWRREDGRREDWRRGDARREDWRRDREAHRWEDRRNREW